MCSFAGRQRGVYRTTQDCFPAPKAFVASGAMQRAARLAAQALRVAPARTRGCASDAAATLRDEGDSRLFAYVLGAFGALPFLAATPQGYEALQGAAKNMGHSIPVRCRMRGVPSQRQAHASGGSRRAPALRRCPWTAPRSCRRGTAARL